MGNKQSSSDEENRKMTPEVELQSNDDAPEQQDPQDDMDLLEDPIQKLFYLLRRDIVDVDAVQQLLQLEGDQKLNLDTPDAKPIIPDDADLKDPSIIKQIERAASKTYLNDYALHFLVGRPPTQNTPQLLELVKLFFLNDHPMNARNLLGATPLHRACSAGNAQMAAALLQWGAQADAVTNTNLTALHMACYAGHTEVVELLLKHGAVKQIKFKCDYGIAPCDYVLKDDILQLLKGAYQSTRGGATATATSTTTSV